MKRSRAVQYLATVAGLLTLVAAPQCAQAGGITSADVFANGVSVTIKGSGFGSKAAREPRAVLRLRQLHHEQFATQSLGVYLANPRDALHRSGCTWVADGIAGRHGRRQREGPGTTGWRRVQQLQPLRLDQAPLRIQRHHGQWAERLQSQGIPPVVSVDARYVTSRIRGPAAACRRLRKRRRIRPLWFHMRPKEGAWVIDEYDYQSGEPQHR